MKSKEIKRLPTRGELLDELLTFSETNPRRRTTMQTALDIRGLRCLASLGTKIEDAEFSRLGKWLAFTATPRELHVLADVIEGDLFGSRIDARRANIAQSWFAAVYRNKKEPTLAQVKEHFLGYFNQQMLPGDHSIRKTLKLIGLPLAKGKVGRPKK